MKISKELKYALIGAGVILVGVFAYNQYTKSKIVKTSEIRTNTLA